jgi:hypothetical protein
MCNKDKRPPKTGGAPPPARQLVVPVVVFSGIPIIPLSIIDNRTLYRIPSHRPIRLRQSERRHPVARHAPIDPAFHKAAVHFAHGNSLEAAAQRGRRSRRPHRLPERTPGHLGTVRPRRTPALLWAMLLRSDVCTPQSDALARPDHRANGRGLPAQGLVDVHPPRQGEGASFFDAEGVVLPAWG